MKEGNFAELVAILKLLEQNDVNSVSLEDSVIGLLDRFEGQLSETQRSSLLTDFIRYEDKRQAKQADHEKRFTTQEQQFFRKSQNDYYG